jgi:paraquat-inducible protein B
MAAANNVELRELADRVARLEQELAGIQQVQRTQAEAELNTRLAALRRDNEITTKSKSKEIQLGGRHRKSHKKHPRSLKRKSKSRKH